MTARIHLRHRIELWPVPIWATDRGDLTGVVQEGVGIAGLCLETELVRNLGKPVPVIVNLDLIEDILSEFEEVWAPRGLL